MPRLFLNDDELTESSSLVDPTAAATLSQVSSLRCC